MYDIHIVRVNAYEELRKTIYENVQNSIPAELKKEYPYCENGLLESLSVSYIVVSMWKSMKLI